MSENLSSKDYEIIKEIGEGSYGRVYLAKLNRQISRASENQLIVVKEISFRRLSKQEQELAKKETEILSLLNHPNIIGYFGSFLEDQKFHILMDYADGGDLGEQIASASDKHENFSEEKIMNWFIQICFALQHIHEKKILHRDIKTQNVFLTKKGIVKLGDFGIAKMLDQTNSFAKTSIGTPFYLSPEICEGRPYNAKSDIWSLGCVLYELCTLDKPFNSNCINGLIIKIISKKPSPIPSCYSKNLQQLVDKLLLKKPAMRPNINQILRIKFVHDKVGQFLSSTKQQLEFNHTMLMEIKNGRTERNSKTQSKAVRKSRLPTRQKSKNPTTPTQHSTTANLSTSKPDSTPQAKTTSRPKTTTGSATKKSLLPLRQSKPHHPTKPDPEPPKSPKHEEEEEVSIDIEDDFISDDEDLQNLADVAQNLHENPPPHENNDDEEDSGHHITNFLFRDSPLDLKEKTSRSKRNDEVREFIIGGLGKEKFEKAYKLVIDESEKLSEDQVDEQLSKILVNQREMDYYQLIQQLVVAENAEDSTLDYF